MSSPRGELTKMNKQFTLTREQWIKNRAELLLDIQSFRATIIKLFYRKAKESSETGSVDVIIPIEFMDTYDVDMFRSFTYNNKAKYSNIVQLQVTFKL